MATNHNDQPIQPVSGTVAPRFAGPSTFARLPELRDAPRCDVAILGIPYVIERIRERIGDHPVYLSVDIDVLDPAHAPGAGTPEVAGMTTRELLGVLRGLAGSRIVAADVVEVAPAYDHADITSLAAAATLAYELVNLFACRPANKS